MRVAGSTVNLVSSDYAYESLRAIYQAKWWWSSLKFFALQFSQALKNSLLSNFSNKGFRILTIAFGKQSLIDF